MVLSSKFALFSVFIKSNILTSLCRKIWKEACPDVPVPTFDFEVPKKKTEPAEGYEVVDEETVNKFKDME